tara:strand:- start:49 stop:432 length:384 start_codon:yes stop_codon:yes gene_type:complete
MSTLKTGTVQNNTGTGAPLFKNNSGTEIGQLTKAWVNFNGENTVAISDDFNVSSITDNGTGNYTVNFTNGMGNGNYAAVVSSDMSASNSYAAYERIESLSSTSFVIRTIHSSQFRDLSLLCAAVFGD